MPEYSFAVLHLTESFFNKYPLISHPEILEKDRPYSCIVLEFEDIIMCIPYRSNIRHSYAYHFKSSERSKKNKSGLDYTKMVIIKDKTFLSVDEALVDKDEYKETVKNIKKIKTNAFNYMNDYISCSKNISKISVNEFNRRYLYSTLQYFHEELGI